MKVVRWTRFYRKLQYFVTHPEKIREKVERQRNVDKLWVLFLYLLLKNFRGGQNKNSRRPNGSVRIR